MRFVVANGLDVHLRRSDSAPIVSRGFVFMLWLISVGRSRSEPSDELYSIDQFAFAGTDGTSIAQQLTPMRARGAQC